LHVHPVGLGWARWGLVGLHGARIVFRLQGFVAIAFSLLKTHKNNKCKANCRPSEAQALRELAGKNKIDVQETIQPLWSLKSIDFRRSCLDNIWHSIQMRLISVPISSWLIRNYCHQCLAEVDNLWLVVNL
jgi:hypothetical protein